MIKLFLRIFFDEAGVLRNLPLEATGGVQQSQQGLSPGDLIKLLIAKQTAKTKVAREDVKRGQSLEDKKEIERFKASLKQEKPATLTGLSKGQQILGLTPEKAFTTEKFKGLTQEVETEELGPLGVIRKALTGQAPGRKKIEFTPEAAAIRSQVSAQLEKGTKLRKETKVTAKLKGGKTIDKTGKAENFTDQEETLIQENMAAFPNKTRSEVVRALRTRQFIK